MRTVKSLLKNAIRMMGYDVTRIRKNGFEGQLNEETVWHTHGLTKAQYGCGTKFMKGWLNVDYYPRKVMKERYGMTHDYVYYQADLTLRQPFENESFDFGFAEDFIEHISQADSLVFLSECYRVLRERGVLRLSFPGLEGVLRSHYRETDYKTAAQGKKDAYERHNHIHFFSKEELRVVAEHLGFSEVKFVEYRCSDYEELRELDTRDRQQYINTYVELIK